VPRWWSGGDGPVFWLIGLCYFFGVTLMLIIKPDPPVLYCDCSRAKAGKFTVVAGAIASIQKWADFDTQWAQALADNNLKYFRMSEFAQSVGQFAVGWKNREDRRRAFLLRLARIIAEHVACWVGACVSQRDYNAADRVYELHEYLQPYPLCGVTCIELAHKWQKANKLDFLAMRYIFEDGDQHSGQLSERAREDFGQSPIFVPKLRDKRASRHLTDNYPLTPLQVGDFAAYEIGKFYSIVDPGVEELFEKFRESFRLIAPLPQQWGDLSETAIRVGLNMRGVPRRINY
jgi:hypothetical protein